MKNKEHKEKEMMLDKRKNLMREGKDRMPTAQKKVKKNDK